ncbi:DUF7261 family protein [Natrarchaeobius oligotrophus]|uniref:Uncharacterized protein n=1 Tax=Natrarchaeobius chitinivorans TaxID=1679083 RepID=A0A3N6PL92_NATCH|nr:hypothetical protein [Natrarchaeobius chitinivorans]RQG99675.1 hypothetical protein EA472_13545 [Natrarchaeobius chitinivorans]
MVTDVRDRGQVLLIGAIVIAFVVLGTVVAYNGLMHTETLSSSSTGQDVERADVTGHELEQAIQGRSAWYVERRGGLETMLQASDPETEFYDEDEWETVIVDEVLPHYRDDSIKRTPAVVDVTNVSESASISVLENEGAPVGDYEGEEVFNGTETGGNVFEFEVWNFDYGGGSSEVITIETPEQQIDFVVDQGAEEIRYAGDDCQINERIEGIDFVEGTVVDRFGGTTSCDFGPIEKGMEVERIVFTDMSSAYEYDLRGVGESHERGNADEIPWIVDVTYTYDSNDVSSERTIEVDLYGELL